MSSGITADDPVAIIRTEAALHDTALQAVIGTGAGGEIVYWNRAAERLYGWTFAEVEGRSILDVTPTLLSKEQAKLIMNALTAGRSWSGSFEVQSKSGAEFRVRVRDVPVRDRYGELVGVIGLSSRLADPGGGGQGDAGGAKR